MRIETFLLLVVMIYFQTKSGDEGGHQQVLVNIQTVLYNLCYRFVCVCVHACVCACVCVCVCAGVHIFAYSYM